MKEKKDFYQLIEEICESDRRYKPDAYEFMMQALHFTQNKLRRQTHLTGAELLEGIREFSVEQFGPMVKTVFLHWGVKKTEDFGNIVFNMVDKKILSKTETDSINDFKDVYDFEAAFSNIIRDSIIKNLEQINYDLQKDS